MKHALLLVAGLTLGTGTAQALTVTSIGGAVQVTAVVTDNGGSIIALTSGSDGFSGAPVVLSADAIATYDTGSASLSSHGGVTAGWISASAGTVFMRDFGWDSTPGISGGASVNSGGPNWSYTFTPSADAVYTMNYTVAGFGNTFGLWGFFNAVDGVGDYSTIDAFNPNSSGTFTKALTGGTTYSVQLYNNANAGFGPDTFSAMDGAFAWSITGAGVPEPASWAMLIAGFGMVGGTLRARRRVVA
jgi:hypothetical protein